MTATPMPSRTPEIDTVDLGGAVALYDPLTGQVHILNPVAAILWRSCDGTTLEAEVVAQLAEASGIDPVELGMQVTRYLADLRDKGLLERDTPPDEVRNPASILATPEAGQAPGEHASLTYGVLGLPIGFRSDDPDLIDALDDRFEDLAVDVPPSVLYGVGRDGDGRWWVRGGDGTDLSGTGDGALVEAVGELLDRLTGWTPAVLALHGGAVRDAAGRVVVLAGRPDAGIPALVADLVEAGWDYLGDRAIGVLGDAHTAVAFPTPPAEGGILGDIREGAVAVSGRGEAGPIVAVVVARLAPGSEVVVERHEELDAFGALVPLARNLSAARGPGLATLVGIADRSGCVELIHPGGAAAVAAIEDLVAAGGNDPEQGDVEAGEPQDQ
jgi:PqqD family protein of HPr-rel-A system